jgi:hypothetical protein
LARATGTLTVRFVQEVDFANATAEVVSGSLDGVINLQVTGSTLRRADRRLDWATVGQRAWGFADRRMLEPRRSNGPSLLKSDQDLSGSVG